MAPMIIGGFKYPIVFNYAKGGGGSIGLTEVMMIIFIPLGFVVLILVCCCCYCGCFKCRRISNS